MSSVSENFAGFGLVDPLLRALEDVGYEAPSPIQAACLPPLLAGEDVFGQAQTGTGKTAAFALPLLQRLDLSLPKPQALILTPTRELAMQVAESLRGYARHMAGVQVLSVYGGQGMGTQLQALRGRVHVVVGTPGRVMDHVSRGTLQLSDLKLLVLDEADEMLRMGFIDDVEWLLERMPAERQMALFSATLPDAIRAIARRHMRHPKEIHIASATKTVAAVRQRYWQVRDMHKQEVLTRLLEVEDVDAALVFVRTKIATTEVADALIAKGFAAAAMHGDMNQHERERTIAQLKSGRLNVVVATDVAARGLDVARISHVINYDVPLDAEAYVHRIGRTGRAGRGGEAILFVFAREVRMLRVIERSTGQRIESMNPPTLAQIAARRVERFTQRIVQGLAAAEPDRDETARLDYIRAQLLQLCTEHDIEPMQLAAALARMLDGDNPIFITPEEIAYADPQYRGRPAQDSAPWSDRSGRRESAGDREESRFDGSRNDGSRNDGSRSDERSLNASKPRHEYPSDAADDLDEAVNEPAYAPRAAGASRVTVGAKKAGLVTAELALPPVLRPVPSAPVAPSAPAYAQAALAGAAPAEQLIDLAPSSNEPGGAEFGGEALAGGELGSALSAVGTTSSQADVSEANISEANISEAGVAAPSNESVHAVAVTAAPVATLAPEVVRKPAVVPVATAPRPGQATPAAPRWPRTESADAYQSSDTGAQGARAQGPASYAANAHGGSGNQSRADQSRDRDGFGSRERPRAERGDRDDRDDRDDRNDRGDRRPRQDADDVPMARYRIEVGREHQVEIRQIVGAIANEGGIDGRYIGRIDMNAYYSTLDLPADIPRDLLRFLTKVRVGRYMLRVTRLIDGEQTDRPDDNAPARVRRRFSEDGADRRPESRFDNRSDSRARPPAGGANAGSAYGGANWPSRDGAPRGRDGGSAHVPTVGAARFERDVRPERRQSSWRPEMFNDNPPARDNPPGRPAPDSRFEGRPPRAGGATDRPERARAPFTDRSGGYARSASGGGSGGGSDRAAAPRRERGSYSSDPGSSPARRAATSPWAGARAPFANAKAGASGSAGAARSPGADRPDGKSAGGSGFKRKSNASGPGKPGGRSTFRDKRRD